MSYRKRPISSTDRHGRPAKRYYTPNIGGNDGDIRLTVNTPTSMMNKSDRKDNNNIMAEADSTSYSNSYGFDINSNKSSICNCYNDKLDSATTSTSSLNHSNNPENSNIVVSKCCSLFKSSLDLIKTLIQRPSYDKPMPWLLSPSTRSHENITPSQDPNSISLWDMSSNNKYDKRTHTHDNGTSSQDTINISLRDTSFNNEYIKCLQDIGQLSIQDNMKNSPDLELNSLTSIKYGSLMDHGNNLLKNSSESDCCKEMEVCDSQYTQFLTKDYLKSDHRYCPCQQPSHHYLENEIHRQLIEKLIALNLLD